MGEMFVVFSGYKFIESVFVEVYSLLFIAGAENVTFCKFRE